MMLSEFIGFLKTLFTDTKFYNGAVNRDETECIGIYRRDGTPSKIALGGLPNTSYSILPITILIHWTENSNTCETKAIEIFNSLFGLSNFNIGNRRIVSIVPLSSGPIDVGRDDKNIVEMVIRLNIIYER